MSRWTTVGAVEREEDEGQVAKEAEDLRFLERATVVAIVFEAAAGHILHDEVGPRLAGVEVEDAEQAGLIHGGADAGLAAEAGHSVLAGASCDFGRSFTATGMSRTVCQPA